MPDHDLAPIERAIVSQITAQLTVESLAWVVEPSPYEGNKGAVIFQFMSAIDKAVTTAGDSLFVEGLYQIVAVMEGKTLGATNLQKAAGAIHTAMHQIQVANESGRVYWSERERPVRMRDTRDGRDLIMLGGIYRIESKAT